VFLGLISEEYRMEVSCGGMHSFELWFDWLFWLNDWDRNHCWIEFVMLLNEIQSNRRKYTHSYQLYMMF
jgi:galactose mutarotase-like enzyme